MASRAYSLLEANSIHERHFRTGWVSRDWLRVWKINWHGRVSPVLNFLRLWENLLSMILTILNFIWLSVECRVWLWWFHASQAISHSFPIKSDIHFLPVILAMIDWRCRFFISAQFEAASPIWSWSNPMFWWLSNFLAAGVGREGGGAGDCHFCYADIPFRISDSSWGYSLFRPPHLWRNFWILSHVESTFENWNTLVVSSYRWIYPLGKFSEGQAPHFDMMVHVGSCCGAILVAHLCWYLVSFFFQAIGPTSILFAEICIRLL